MKKRTNGFLSKDKICHDSEQFDYIRELHDYLWAFVRCQLPTANGKLSDYLDIALNEAQLRALAENNPTSQEQLVTPDVSVNEVAVCPRCKSKEVSVKPVTYDCYECGATWQTER